jgi:hypothetical protein
LLCGYITAYPAILVMPEQVVSGSTRTKPRSKYKEGYGYCSRCRRFYLLEPLGMPDVGIPRCPECKSLMRTRPR